MEPAGDDRARTQQRPARDRSVETLRGIAVLLMVAGHVIGDDLNSGLTVDPQSPWRFAYLILEDLRMPMFTVISGYVYAMRPVAGQDAMPGFLQGKARRLLVPFVVVGTLSFALKLVLPGTNTPAVPGEWWRTYVYGFEHLWFLLSITIIFAVVGWLDATGLLRTRRAFAVALGASFVLHVVPRLPNDWNVLGINGALRLAPFFLVGYGLCRHRSLLDRRRLLPAVALGFVAAWSLRVVLVASDTATVDALTDRTVGLAVGVCGLLVLWRLRHVVDHPLLAQIGGYSFAIFLLHVFGTASTRIVIERLWPGATAWPLFLIGLVAGVAVPIAFERTAGRHPWVARLALGTDPRTGRRALRLRPQAS